MSIFTTIRDAIFKNYLKGVFTKQNLTQASTWKGLIRIAIAAGIFQLSPEAQDALVMLILQIIATGEMGKGLIDVIRNENKKLPWRGE